MSVRRNDGRTSNRVACCFQNALRTSGSRPSSSAVTRGKLVSARHVSCRFFCFLSLFCAPPALRSCRQSYCGTRGTYAARHTLSPGHLTCPAVQYNEYNKVYKFLNFCIHSAVAPMPRRPLRPPDSVSLEVYHPVTIARHLPLRRPFFHSPPFWSVCLPVLSALAFSCLSSTTRRLLHLAPSRCAV